MKANSIMGCLWGFVSFYEREVSCHLDELLTSGKENLKPISLTLGGGAAPELASRGASERLLATGQPHTV